VKLLSPLILYGQQQIIESFWVGALGLVGEMFQLVSEKILLSTLFSLRLRTPP